jgi:hypothetical protein
VACPRSPGGGPPHRRLAVRAGRHDDVELLDRADEHVAVRRVHLRPPAAAVIEAHSAAAAGAPLAASRAASARIGTGPINLTVTHWTVLVPSGNWTVLVPSGTDLDPVADERAEAARRDAVRVQLVVQREPLQQLTAQTNTERYSRHPSERMGGAGLSRVSPLLFCFAVLFCCVVLLCCSATGADV